MDEDSDRERKGSKRESRKMKRNKTGTMGKQGTYIDNGDCLKKSVTDTVKDTVKDTIVDNVEKLTAQKANLVFKNVKSPEYAHTIARVLETLGNLKGNLNVYVYVSEDQKTSAPAINIAEKIRHLLDSLGNFVFEHHNSTT